MLLLLPLLWQLTMGGPAAHYEVVRSFPHDPNAFTEGLFYRDSYLYESTGLNGHSSIRKVELATGAVIQKFDLPETYFGEGIAPWKDEILQLTYTSEVGFVYDAKTFQTRRQFSYKGQGWALTTDGKEIYMDDGSADIRVWSGDTLHETRRIHVTTPDHQPVLYLNELEWVDGELLANVWHSDQIARIDPQTGSVKGWIDLSGLLPNNERRTDTADQVLNGIAWDPQHRRLFVTGKYWPRIYQIKIQK